MLICLGRNLVAMRKSVALFSKLLTFTIYYMDLPAAHSGHAPQCGLYFLPSGGNAAPRDGHADKLRIYGN